MKVRAGNRYVERPARELFIEALGAPIWLLVFWREFRGGW